MNKKDRQYNKEMDLIEQHMFTIIEFQLRSIEIQLEAKYKKVRSPFKKRRIANIIGKKRCIDNFIFNFKHGNIDKKLFYMLFGLDYKYLDNTRLYQELFSILSVARHIYNIDKFPKCNNTEKTINSSNDKVIPER